MSFVGLWVARLSQTWFDGFRQRHGLDRVTHQYPASDSFPAEGERVLLHVGCGHAQITHIPLLGFQEPSWQEVRFDADQSVYPDIVGTMVDMSAIPNGFADAIYSSHNIEHLYPHEVPTALAEFCRVLKLSGFFVVTCPDLQSLCRLVVDDKLDDPAYISSVGPIAPIDMLYGHRSSMAAGNLFMAHRCGFTLTTLMAALREAGFTTMRGFRRPNEFDLWVLASKSPRTEDEMSALAHDYLVTNP